MPHFVSRTDVHKPISVLSGGEKSRVSLEKTLLVAGASSLLDRTNQSFRYGIVPCTLQMHWKNLPVRLFLCHMTKIFFITLLINSLFLMVVFRTYELPVWSISWRNRMERRGNYVSQKQNNTKDHRKTLKTTSKKLKRTRKNRKRIEKLEEKNGEKTMLLQSVSLEMITFVYDNTRMKLRNSWNKSMLHTQNSDRLLLEKETSNKNGVTWLLMKIPKPNLLKKW